MNRDVLRRADDDTRTRHDNRTEQQLARGMAYSWGYAGAAVAYLKRSPKMSDHAARAYQLGRASVLRDTVKVLYDRMFSGDERRLVRRQLTAGWRAARAMLTGKEA